MYTLYHRLNINNKVVKRQKAKNQLYDKYHSKTFSQKRVIKKKNFTYRHLIEVIQKYWKDKKNVLDIGAGSGTLSIYLASRGHSVVGIDISKKAIRAAAESSIKFGLEKNLKFKKMDFPQEFPQKKFDFILCTEVIEHIEEEGEALSRIYNLLNNDGIVIVSVPSKNAPLFKLGLCKKFDKEVGHVRRYFLKEIVRKCKNEGFNILEVQKNEGLLRNLLFVNPLLGKSIRIFNKIQILSDLITAIDKIFLSLFGESQLILVLNKK